ncbi:MAG: hypothetical protein U9Q79_01485 [Candidatus Hydrogenedentes bacterium]|nr:hypothetical protein [Candidatus Hydrogenedentota bacterium]
MNSQPESVETIRLDPPGCISDGWNLIKDQYGLFLGITFVGTLLAGLVPFGIIAGPMYCGIFLALFMKMRQQPIEFATLFKGFDYFLESLIVTLLIIVASVAFAVPMVIAFLDVIFVGVGIGESMQSGGVAALIIIPLIALLVLAIIAFGVFIYGLMFFAYPLLVDRNLKAMPALKLSARAVWANKWGILGLMFLNCLVSMIGALLCYIGLFLYLPIMFASLAVAYRRMFPEVVPPPAPQF